MSFVNLIKVNVTFVQSCPVLPYFESLFQKILVLNCIFLTPEGNFGYLEPWQLRMTELEPLNIPLTPNRSSAAVNIFPSSNSSFLLVFEFVWLGVGNPPGFKHLSHLLNSKNFSLSRGGGLSTPKAQKAQQSANHLIMMEVQTTPFKAQESQLSTDLSSPMCISMNGLHFDTLFCTSMGVVYASLHSIAIPNSFAAPRFLWCSLSAEIRV